MGAQKSLLRMGASALALAGITAEVGNSIQKERERQQKELFKKYKKALSSSKKGYEKEANIKQENKQIVNNITKPEANSFGIEAIADNQPAEKQVVENKKTNWEAELEVLHPQPKQKFILSEEGAYYPIKAENSQTNIPVDEDVKALNVVKEKSALRAAAGKKNQGSYQEIKAKLTGRFATEHNIEDVWRSINLDPNIDDKMIRKAGLTKTQILEMWEATENKGDNALADLFEKNNADQYGLVTYEEDPDMREKFGPLLSEYIRAKVDGRTLEEKDRDYWAQKENELDIEEEQQEASNNYSVWDDHPEWEGKSRQEILDSFVF